MKNIQMKPSVDMEKTDERGGPPLQMELDLVNPTGDIDGFLIQEKEGEAKVYVYYTELDELIQKLRKKRHEHSLKNISVQQLPLSSEDNINAVGAFKACGDVGSFKKYGEYIKSDLWQQKRGRRLKKDEFRCVNCGSNVGLEVHHVSYDRLGDECVDDLRTLCAVCHARVTARSSSLRRRGVLVD